MKLHRRPVVIGTVLDAPDVVNDFPLKLVEFNSRNQLAVALGKSIYIWDEGNVRLLTESESIITSLCWADAGLVISAHGDVELWDVTRPDMTQALAPHSGRCGAMAFRGSRLATGGLDGLVKITDLRTPTATTVSGHHSEVSVLSWSPNCANVASGGCDGRVIIWGDDKRRSVELAGSIRGLHYMTPSILAAGTMDPAGTVTILHGRQPHEPSSVATGAPVSGIAFADRWGLLVAHHQASFDWEIWSPELKMIGQYPGHAADIINIAVSPDASLAATIGADETLQIWGLRDGKARTPSFSRTRFATIDCRLR
jgi:WD40 repeat protein